jgi:hypothetical protein
VGSDKGDAHSDEHECWYANKLRWTAGELEKQGNPVRNWLALRDEYSSLTQSAIDTMTIPAPSCDCERMFSDLVNLFTPERCSIGPSFARSTQMRAAMGVGWVYGAEPDVNNNLTGGDSDGLYGINR